MIPPTITIIIPVWNAALTIEKCVDSILLQTIVDWELLLVDDGSLDDSLRLCRAMADKDPRIRVIANSHGGVSKTRNTAIDAAHGDYICYIDSDDTVDPNYLECLYTHRDADMVVCGYWYDVYDKEGSLKQQDKHVQPERLYTSEQKAEMKTLFESGAMHINCNKLLRRDIIEKNNLRYKPYPINEDFIFMMEYLLHTNTIYVVEKATYHWIRREGILTGVDSIPVNTVAIYNEAHKLLRKYFCNHQKIADQIMYYSYNIIEHRYLKAKRNGSINKVEFSKRIAELKQNQLIKDAYRIYHPHSLGEYITYLLFRFHQYKIYEWLFVK